MVQLLLLGNAYLYGQNMRHLKFCP